MPGPVWVALGTFLRRGFGAGSQVVEETVREKGG